MDEPFSALDVQTRQLMENEVLELWAAKTRAVLFVTHDLDEAIAMSDRVVVLSAGPATRPIGEFVMACRAAQCGRGAQQSAFRRTAYADLACSQGRSPLGLRAAVAESGVSMRAGFELSQAHLPGSSHRATSRQPFF
jgi:energy-coupling factor transporter ATP-binding protein EcfA2